MEQKYKCLSTSIFCSASHWNHVLNEIALFLHKMQLEDQNSFFLQFNYQGGENIRWALFIPADQVDNFTRQIDDHFNYFFSKANLPLTKSSTSVETDLLPFPQNSIQYGLYRPVYSDGFGTLQDFGIRSSLSWLMIEALASDNIDDETILTFTFYLHIALIKLMLTRGLASLTELRNIHIYNYMPIGDPLTIKKVEDNRERIFEMANDIINPAKEDDVPIWLQKWMDRCDTEIRKELPYPYTKKNELHYRRLIYHLHIQLGITVNMESLLLFFLYQVFRSDILEEMYTI